MYRMRVIEVFKGRPKLADSVIEVASIKELPRDATFWIVGYGEAPTEWDSPEQVSTKALSYLRGLSRLPERGPRRLGYFLRFLQHGDELVAADAYNEFAEATLEDIAAVADQLDREWVISQLRDASVPVHRRRLCWTFLSQCGTAADASLFDEMLRKREVDATFDPGMDAAIACFIALAGERGLGRVEQAYLASSDAEYLDSFAAINAIRVHGTQLKVLPRERLAAALRLMLCRPTLADLVIPDLARWGDWSMIDRVAKLFEEANEEARFVKPAAVLYLKTCPLPAAAEALERLRAIDAQTVQAAEASMRFYNGPTTVPVPPPSDDDASSGLQAP
ncbi:hypothetical protein Mal15_04370 [Stieleria maiorica]|uniref:Uncharacterized protein n=2 Tax=Stieleria maiorica TaxID=2795974 RepID=A0A5B9M6F1_9BACT|nr:hypothetical protein Mal15_04370 [Stieleria maiorica]